MVVASTIIWYLGSALALRYSPRLSMAIGGFILISGVLASSFVESFNWFAVFYGLGFGFGYGISLFPPIISAWSYFPKRKGVANGIIIAAFGMGSAVFNLIATAIVNPDNQPPDLEVNRGKVTEYYYDFDIASRVPEMLRTLALIWFILVVLGTIMVCDIKKNDDSPRDNIQEENIE